MRQPVPPLSQFPTRAALVAERENALPHAKIGLTRRPPSNAEGAWNVSVYLPPPLFERKHVLPPPRETALEGDRRVGDMCYLFSALEGDRRFGDMCCLFFVARCSAKGGNAAISTSSRLETFGVATPLSRRFGDPKMRFPVV